jgi:hypothetical protein
MAGIAPADFLSLTDDLKALAYAAVAVSTGRGHVCIAFVADAGLAVLRGWRKVFRGFTHWSTPDRF